MLHLALTDPSIVPVQAFEIALQQCGATAETSIFVDDSNRNVMAARQMGIFTVQVRPALWTWLTTVYTKA